ncbi:MAG: tRNA guanosine(15) transglycosylase TgtA [Candidatus Korarchaeota archaeon]
MVGEFEVAHQDIWGRIGRLMTKSGPLDTPVFLPVVDPRHPDLVTEMRKMHIDAIITNSYFAYKHGIDDIHKHLPFRIIMTDSGAFQILKYGGIDVTQEEIVRAHERMGSDIAVILDIPTGINASRKEVETSVERTLKRAEEWNEIKSREDIVWVGPVQGGVHLDLVQKCAVEISKFPFAMHAFGSPVEFLERYEFAPILASFIAARTILPINRPLHFFGVGLPAFFSVAVAAGADVFDSASYILYARDGRYITIEGVRNISELAELPCECPICLEYALKEIKYDWKLIALHNLCVIMGEMRKIREAIREGRLWELVENRAKIHPSIYRAFMQLANTPGIERGTPVSKKHGIFMYEHESAFRPEVRRHLTRLKAVSLYSGVACIFPDEGRPLPNWIFKFAKNYCEILDVFLLSPAFGLIPLEASTVFPLSQYESAGIENREVIKKSIDSVHPTLKEIWVADEKLLWIRDLSPCPVKLIPEEIKTKIQELKENCG